MPVKNIYFECPGCKKKIENGPDHIYYSGNGYSQIIINRYKLCKLKNLPILLDYKNLEDTLFLTLPKRNPPDIPLDKSLPSSNVFINITSKDNK